MDKDIQKRLHDYLWEHPSSEVGVPLVIIAEVLLAIKKELVNITNKLYE